MLILCYVFSMSTVVDVVVFHQIDKTLQFFSKNFDRNFKTFKTASGKLLVIPHICVIIPLSMDVKKHNVF